MSLAFLRSRTTGPGLTVAQVLPEDRLSSCPAESDESFPLAPRYVTIRCNRALFLAQQRTLHPQLFHEDHIQHVSTSIGTITAVEAANCTFGPKLTDVQP